ncbi:glycosyltransferase [Paenibacillus sp. HWE-109]|uniref:glycosyltransferase n=1 Tax=Paenibacillus sp. HWE-109 TaxID=1306526 RepID=UPI001EDF54A4|nr:glycosyltransferase [Paenibacillus sp. HWE-109]UKS29210.1 glycosyltransferase [Paenibacillus sp. HWE-109]
MVRNQSKPSISIVICTFNRADLLHLTLESILALEDLDQTEILIVDNNSTDHTRDVADTFIQRYLGILRVQYVFEQKQGLSAARNSGIEQAQGDIVAFLDDDAIPCKVWIRTMLTTFGEQLEVEAMGGRIRPNFESERPEWLIKGLEMPYTIVDLGPKKQEYPVTLHPFGANMAIRKSFLVAHYFPTHLGRIGNMLLSGEESWLFEQMKKQRKVILYHPDMIVDHFIPDSRLTQDWIKKRYYYQGVTNGSMHKGNVAKLILLGKVAAKVVYIAGEALCARSAGKKLLVACRMESIRGTLDTMRKRNNMQLTR